MGLDYMINNNKSSLKFRVELPQQTSKSSRYPFERQLLEFADKYLKKNHPKSKDARKQLIKFTEVYDGLLYLELVLYIKNHKNETVIINIDEEDV